MKIWSFEHRINYAPATGFMRRAYSNDIKRICWYIHHRNLLNTDRLYIRHKIRVCKKDNISAYLEKLAEEVKAKLRSVYKDIIQKDLKKQKIKIEWDKTWYIINLTDNKRNCIVSVRPNIKIVASRYKPTEEDKNVFNVNYRRMSDVNTCMNDEIEKILGGEVG